MTIRNIILLLILLLSTNALSNISTHADDGTLRRLRVPILMYHYVSPLPQDANEIRTDLTVLPEQFRLQLQYLKEQGYTSVSLYEVHQALRYGAPLPDRPIILTFDDSYIDAYTYAFPLLREFGFRGTFFVITSFTDNNNANHLSWQQISEMAQAGMHIETHTKYHTDLRNSDYEHLVYEIVGSIESIKAHTGKTSIALAYPMGRYNAELLQYLEGFPIEIAVTTERGMIHTSTSMLELPRIRISNDTTVYGLDRLLNSQ